MHWQVPHEATSQNDRFGVSCKEAQTFWGLVHCRSARPLAVADAPAGRAGAAARGARGGASRADRVAARRGAARRHAGHLLVTGR
jgi:hypothetical protein